MTVSSKTGLHYQYIGDTSKPTVVLAHPLGMDMHVWDYLIPDLTIQFSVLRFDLPGHGDGKPFPSDINVLADSRLVDDLLSLCGELGIGQFHFIGTSIGGVLGQQLLINHAQRLLSATLTNTGMKIGSRDGWLARQANVNSKGLQTMAAELVPRWFSEYSARRYPNLLSHWETSLAQTDDRSYGLLCAWLGERDLTAALNPVEVPVLLIAGENDVATPVSDLDALGETLKAPVKVLSQTGHVPSIESSREFTALVREHLQNATLAM